MLPSSVTPARSGWLKADVTFLLGSPEPAGSVHGPTLQQSNQISSRAHMRHC